MMGGGTKEIQAGPRQLSIEHIVSASFGTNRENAPLNPKLYGVLSMPQHEGVQGASRGNYPCTITINVGGKNHTATQYLANQALMSLVEDLNVAGKLQQQGMLETAYRLRGLNLPKLDIHTILSNFFPDLSIFEDSEETFLPATPERIQSVRFSQARSLDLESLEEPVEQCSHIGLHIVLNDGRIANTAVEKTEALALVQYLIATGGTEKLRLDDFIFRDLPEGTNVEKRLEQVLGGPLRQKSATTDINVFNLFIRLFPTTL